jgi:hypothetical protein
VIFLVQRRLRGELIFAALDGRLENGRDVLWVHDALFNCWQKLEVKESGDNIYTQGCDILGLELSIERLGSPCLY